MNKIENRKPGPKKGEGSTVIRVPNPVLPRVNRIIEKFKTKSKKQIKKIKH